jgi:glycerol-1-phosphate dehydrogenase [NAD(P)+]
MARGRNGVDLPTFVRIKPGALHRCGVYARRNGHGRVVAFLSAGLPDSIRQPVFSGFHSHQLDVTEMVVEAGSLESVLTLLPELPPNFDAVFGIGGGRALDVSKYIAHLANRPFYSVPTSLSNDGFGSPQSSLTVKGKRRSLPAAVPFAVVVDTAACLAAPEELWWSGVGDLVAKITAGWDWKCAYHRQGEPVDDLSVLMSDATVYQFLARPFRDAESIRLLATALLLNGVSMAMAGSSRPASGAEHLISHALDERGVDVRMHGIQVGLAAYVVSRLQNNRSELIGTAFEQTGFWTGVRSRPVSRREWLAAVKAASAGGKRYTVLATRDCLPEVAALIESDPTLAGCFRLD